MDFSFDSGFEDSFNSGFGEGFGEGFGDDLGDGLGEVFFGCLRPCTKTSTALRGWRGRRRDSGGDSTDMLSVAGVGAAEVSMHRHVTSERAVNLILALQM